MDRDTALQAFSLAIEPLPGVAVPRGPKTTIRSGSAAARWALGHRSTLSAEQLAVVKRAVQPGPGDTVVVRPRRPGAAKPTTTPSKGGGGGARPWLEPSNPDKDPAALTALVADGIDKVEQRLGRSLRQQVEVEINKANEGDDPRTLALAGSFDANGDVEGPPVTCHIKMNPRAFAKTRSVLLETVYHEVFHCFQAELFPDLATYFDKGHALSWLIEGQAEWAGCSLAGSDDGTPYHWTEYLTDPGKSLFARSYDALGFYSHLAEAGTDPWRVMDAMVRASITGGNEAAFNAAMAGNEAKILDTWPSGYARGRRPGAPWDTAGPGITKDRMQVFTAGVPSGGSAPVKGPAVANRLLKLDLRADVTTFTVSPGAHGRLGPSTGADLLLTELAGRNWCTRGDGKCACPEGTAGAGSELPRLAPGVAWLALTGGLKAASVTAVGTNLAEQCRKKPDKAACMVGNWTTTRVSLVGKLATVAGGAGITMRVAPDYVAQIGFDAMAPVQGTMNLPGKPGMKFRYHGILTGKLAAASGTYTTTPGAAAVSASASLVLGGTEIAIFNHTPLSKIGVGTSPAAGAIDKSPVLGATQYTCTPTTLTLTGIQPELGTVTWVFARA